jgi:hypothetical protein
MGEFTEGFQVLAVIPAAIELIFSQGIDWRAFWAAFQALGQHHPQAALTLQGVECQGPFLMIRLQVVPEADKVKLEAEIKALYHQEIERLEDDYKQHLKDQGRDFEDVRGIITAKRQEQATPMGMISTLARQQPDLDF